MDRFICKEEDWALIYDSIRLLKQNPLDAIERNLSLVLSLRWLFIVFFVQICIQDSCCSVHRRATIFGSVEGP